MAVTAAGELATGLAGQSWDIAAPRDLHEHRPRLQRSPSGLPGDVRKPRAHRTGITRELDVGPRCQDARATTPKLRPRKDDLTGPAGTHERGSLDRAGRGSQDDGRARSCGTHGQHVTGVPVRRVRISEGIVTVVPEHHEAQVSHGREHSGSGPDHDGDVPATDLQERLVARRRTQVCGEDPVPVGAVATQAQSQGRIEPGDVTGIGGDDKDPAARRRCGEDEMSNGISRVETGSARPDRPRTGRIGSEG